MKPLEPISLDGRRYYHVTAAARIVNVDVSTMWRWAAKNVTSFGFELDCTRNVAPVGQKGRRRAKRRDFRLLIPEEKVIVLKQVLRDFPLDPRGHLSEYERDTLKQAAHLYSRRGDSPKP